MPELGTYGSVGAPGRQRPGATQRALGMARSTRNDEQTARFKPRKRRQGRTRSPPRNRKSGCRKLSTYRARPRSRAVSWPTVRSKSLGNQGLLQLALSTGERKRTGK